MLLTSALDGGEWSASSCGFFTMGKMAGFRVHLVGTDPACLQWQRSLATENRIPVLEAVAIQWAILTQLSRARANFSPVLARWVTNRQANNTVTLSCLLLGIRCYSICGYLDRKKPSSFFIIDLYFASNTMIIFKSGPQITYFCWYLWLKSCSYWKKHIQREEMDVEVTYRGRAKSVVIWDE
jgi:hypothetical protein